MKPISRKQHMDYGELRMHLLPRLDKTVARIKLMNNWQDAFQIQMDLHDLCLEIIGFYKRQDK